MKKLLPVLFAVALLYSGCLKNSDNGMPLRHSIPLSALTGSWYYVTDTTRQYAGDKLQSETVVNSSSTSYLQFNANGTGIQVLVNADGTNTTQNLVDAMSGNNISITFVTANNQPTSELHGRILYPATNEMELMLESTGFSTETGTTETIVLTRK